jgi:L,D-transpeptidase YcbB
VPELRERLHVRGNSGDLTYDRALYNAVRRLQHHHGLNPTGIIDRRTIAAINGPRPMSQNQRIDHVAANMERWRWLPRDLGKAYVMVNIPDYTLKVVHGHDTVWHTKIVAGKPQTPTPLLTASMDTVLVNPSWYVPQSIIQNELLPRYASDPDIFDRMGLEVKKGPDGNINVVQPPGAANALGRIKFNFPNKFQVYLHDTPEKRLFSHDRRAFSHG